MHKTKTNFEGKDNKVKDKVILQYEKFNYDATKTSD